MKIAQTLTLSLLLASAAAFASTTPDDQGNFDKNHPRRAEVNKRLGNQNQRINQEVKEGEMTRGQANKMHREDRQIRGEERAMASQNGGHITKQEQKTLNQQENQVSKQIGK